MNLNDRALALADWCASQAASLRVAVQTLPGGTRVIDAGVAVAGGFGVGRKLAEICMGGLGEVSYVPLTIGGTSWPGVQVWTDHPAVACMASQYAGWQVNVGKFFAMGSGPMRAAYGKGYCDALTEDAPGSLCRDHGYRIPARNRSAAPEV